MNGVVNRLYDIDSIVIPEELLAVSVDEAQVDKQVQMLSARYAKESLVDVAVGGDLVCCTADAGSYPDGRQILIYTGMCLPGAEKAKEAVIGKRAGDVVVTELTNRPVTLTIEKVIRRTPVEVDDALIAGMGIEGVTSVEEYKAHIREKLTEDQKMEKGKAITGYYLQQMTDNSTYSYDEKAMDAYIDGLMEEYIQESQEIGETVTPEEVRDGVIAQEKQNWMIEAFCKEKELPVDLSSVSEETDRMIEMMELMGEEIPNREEMEEAARQDAYFTAFLDYIDQLVAKKTGGAYGNH